MDVQAAPSPYTPVGGTHTQPGNPPVLGSQMLGNTGGLPQPSGLSATANPMAEQLQSLGRNEDTMLVHMTPGEVNSLQGLAMAAGGSLTINPHTGLPEANFLKKLLPMLAGIGLNFILPGAGGIVGALGGKAATAGLLTAAGSTALTGDLNKGLMAGLQAFGGASLAGGLQGALGGAKAASSGSMAAHEAAQGAVQNMAGNAAQGAAGTLQGGAHSMMQAAAPQAVANTAAQSGSGFFPQFGQAARGTMTGLAGKAAPMAAGMGVLSSLSDATTPGMPTPKEEKFNYVPMRAGERRARFQTPEQMRASGGAEFSYFTPSNPDPIPLAEGGSVNAQPQDFNSLVAMYQGQNPGAITASRMPVPSPAMQSPTTSPAPQDSSPAGVLPRGGETMYNFNRPRELAAPGAGGGADRGLGGMASLENLFGGRALLGRLGNNRGQASIRTMASGGAVDMDDGSFVVDARTVSELGNGSSNAGIELLSRMGGRPVQGPGDGVSDSVKASIGGTQEARVARDEVIFSPEAVRRIGGGSPERGTQKLYAMMEKAHKARKKAGRGQDTNLRKGLA